MERNFAKRRKINHGNDASMLESSSAAASAMGPSGASAFVLETEELLKEVKLDYTQALPNVDDTLRRFKDTIESLEPHDPTPIGELSAKFEKTSRIAIPFPNPRPAKDSPYKLSFAKPAQVNVVGSYALKTMIKSSEDRTVDMIVVMPTSIFQDKDYLNLRYFYKRAYYLAYIASGIHKEHGSSMDLSFDYLNGNALLPVLVARPKPGSKKNGDTTKNTTQTPTWGIRVIPTAPEGYFPTSKLSATSNAVRQGKPADTKDVKSPTPFYNSTLKAEGLFTSYLKLLHRASISCPSFKDACILGRIWLQQRGFGSSISEGGFGHFEWAVLVALLLQGGGRKGEAVLSTSLHSTQLFKGTVQFLASANFRKKPVIVGGAPSDPETSRQTGPVLYDTARQLNILFKMTSWSGTMLTEQAKRSLAAINDSPNDQFDSLFIIKAYQPLQMFDLLVKLNLPSSTNHDSTDCKGFAWDYSERVYQTLTRALGERAQLVHLEIPKFSSWPVANSTPKSKKDSIIVGITVDPEKASKGREYGPPYEQKKEAALFREFWGDKSDLWQFSDGNIVESLDWTAYSPLGFPGICEAIIRYILKFRLEVDDSDLTFYGHDFSKIIAANPSDKAAYDSARQAFQQFEKDVRNLEDLPLHVRQIVPICPELRYASLRTPDHSDRRQSLQPMDVIISFEASGKWPEDNLAAIQRAKLAFLLKIGSSLEESSEAIKTHLGLETVEQDVEDLAFLDVIYEGGFSFRVRVHSGLEETLLERQTKDKTLERYQRTEAAELLATFKRTYTNLPLHNQTISTFCTRFPELSASIRLVKRFFSAHKLSYHFNEELIELFTLQAFLKPHPYQTPTSAATGFLRTLLLLSRWDWRDDPLIVDSSESLSPSQRAEIRTRLEAWRKIDPGMNRTVLFVATSHDTSGTAYTAHPHGGPSKVVATRMTTLARSACHLAKDKGIDLDPRTLFQPASLREYDVVIRLAAKVIRSLERGGNGSDAKTSHFKNLLISAARTDTQAPPLPEHPTQTLLKQLDGVYGRPLLFFHGGPDDATIGALWNPQLHRRAFTANLPCSFRPVDEDGNGDGGQMYEVDKSALLAEIARIGGDLIEGIDVNNS